MKSFVLMVVGAVTGLLAKSTGILATVNDVKGLIERTTTLEMKHWVDLSIVISMAILYWLLWREFTRIATISWNPRLKEEFRRLHPALERHLSHCLALAKTGASDSLPEDMGFDLDFEMIRSDLSGLGVGLPPRQPYQHRQWVRFVHKVCQLARKGDLGAARKLYQSTDG